MKKIALVLAILLVGTLFGCAAKEDSNTLYVLNWGDYIDEALLTQFEEETGIQVNYTTMATNEEMMVKLEEADCIYDVCFPSD